MRKVTAAIVLSGMLLVQGTGVSADATRVAQAPTTGDKAGSGGPVRSKGVVGTVTARGTVAAIDKEKGTVTLQGPKRRIKLEVKDRDKLDAIKVGDPVVATYMEAAVLEVKKAGTATPGVSTRETRVSSKPGETPAGAIGEEVTITGTITAIDRKTNQVTVKGPQGGSETITAQDPKNLEGVKVGDMVEVTYTRALAVSLDKPAK